VGNSDRRQFVSGLDEAQARFRHMELNSDFNPTQDQVNEAKKWIEGSFHEIAHAFRVVTWERIREFYESKKKVKDIESELGIM
jgi:preprotein translocase subunit Sec63